MQVRREEAQARLQERKELAWSTAVAVVSVLGGALSKRPVQFEDVFPEQPAEVTDEAFAALWREMLGPGK